MVLASALPMTAFDIVTPIGDRVSVLKTERSVIFTNWRQARKFLVSLPTPIALGDLEATDEFVCVANVYVDIDSGRILLVDVLDAPNRMVARALRIAISGWQFHEGETSTDGAVLSIPVAFYPKRGPDGTTLLIAAD